MEDQKIRMVLEDTNTGHYLSATWHRAANGETGTVRRVLEVEHFEIPETISVDELFSLIENGFYRLVDVYTACE